MALKPGQGLDTWEISTTKKLVAEFRRRSRHLERIDFDDLVQECLLHWIVVRTKVDVDPGDPPVAYMAQVLRNWLNDCIRRTCTDKRCGEQSLAYLDASLDGSEDGPTLADTLVESDSLLVGEEGETRLHLRIDLRRVVPELTPPQLRLCLLLSDEGLSIKSAAEQLRIPRGTLYRDITLIRALFALHGLDIYLKD